MNAAPNLLADHVAALVPDEAWRMDVAQGRSLEMKLRRHREGTVVDREAWKKLLSPKPHLFPSAGMAVLRSGDTPETQIQVTLDYGRNVFHAAYDRNQFTLAAFGKMFTHGPGSTYNVGSGA